MQVLKCGVYPGGRQTISDSPLKNYPELPITDEQVKALLNLLDDVYGESDPKLQAFKNFRSVFPNGGQIHLELEADGCKDIFSLETKSSVGKGGSFAGVKMSTLKGGEYSRIVATGLDTVDAVKEKVSACLTTNRPDPPGPHILLGTYVPEGSKCYNFLSTGCEIINLLNRTYNLDYLERRHHDWLKEHLNYTCYLGGIQVPIVEYEVPRGEANACYLGGFQVPKDPNAKPTIEKRLGWLRLAVSGAAAYQDLAIAIYIADYLIPSVFDFFADFTVLTSASTDAQFLLDYLN